MSQHRYSFALIATLTGLGLVVPRAAHAQSDKTAAEALFQDGKRLMGEGKYSEACPKLDESNKIDPGAGTLTALALCHRGEGKTATAWSEFKEVISLARRDGRKDREQVAEENIAELEPKLSKLTLVVDPAARQPGRFPTSPARRRVPHSIRETGGRDTPLGVWPPQDPRADRGGTNPRTARGSAARVACPRRDLPESCR